MAIPVFAQQAFSFLQLCGAGALNFLLTNASDFFIFARGNPGGVYKWFTDTFLERCKDLLVVAVLASLGFMIFIPVLFYAKNSFFNLIANSFSSVGTFLRYIGLYRLCGKEPQKIVEYYLFDTNVILLTFVITVIFLVAIIKCRNSEKYKNTLLTAAAPLAFTLLVKRMMFVIKWDTSSIFAELSRFLSGTSNSEQAISVVFAFLFLSCFILACLKEAVFEDAIIGFAFLSVDALISKPFYNITLPFLFPFLEKLSSSDSSILAFVAGVFIAYCLFYLLIFCIQAFYRILVKVIQDVKEESLKKGKRGYASEPIY